MLLKSCAKGGMEAEQQDLRRLGMEQALLPGGGWDTASCLARTTTIFP